MTPRELIEEAYRRLSDEHDEDPRSPLMTGLARLTLEPQSIPADESLRLVATCEPGGVFAVTDQHGRKVQGVSSVAVFKDQHGNNVMQINL